MNDRKLIQISDIPKEYMPVIVLADDLRGFIPLIIKNHTQGNYSHVMLMRKPDYFVSQNWLYREIPAERYLKPRYMLKVWRIKEITQEEKDNLNSKINADLKTPWYKRRYDFLGILGQFLKIRQINNPFRRYCSERVAEDLRLISSIKDLLPKYPSPNDLNRIFNQNPEKFECIGYWISDNGKEVNNGKTNFTACFVC